jgi:hypothetical protein
MLVIHKTTSVRLEGLGRKFMAPSANERILASSFLLAVMMKMKE